MATFLYKTKGNSSPERKPRVYFTCHPSDFEKYFEKICEDVFKTHDCTVFYTEDPNVPFGASVCQKNSNWGLAVGLKQQNGGSTNG